MSALWDRRTKTKIGGKKGEINNMNKEITFMDIDCACKYAWGMKNKLVKIDHNGKISVIDYDK